MGMVCSAWVWWVAQHGHVVIPIDSIISPESVAMGVAQGISAVGGTKRKIHNIIL